MSKSEATRIKLENSLDRVLKKTTKIIPVTQKLSVKAVEEEAGLGDGSAYYYKDIILKIKSCATQISSNNIYKTLNEEKLIQLKKRLKNETRLKEKYRDEAEQLKSQLSNLAAQHNQFTLIIEQYKYKVAELEANNISKITE